ncbi:unnamed protein product [Linum trigynum]|uniref:Uncharacterized protein n=1 Tax=Linum trigynum TaxID=586398 RepID=A0AAV2EAY4_9ROSI
MLEQLRQADARVRAWEREYVVLKKKLVVARERCSTPPRGKEANARSGEEGAATREEGTLKMQTGSEDVRGLGETPSELSLPTIPCTAGGAPCAHSCG